MTRLRVLIGVFVVAVVIGGLSVADDPPPRYKGQLPANWKKIGLSEAQTQSVYKIQTEHRQKIDKLKAEIQKASDAAVKTRLENNLAQAEAYLAELKTMKPPVPTRTVSQTVKLQEGGREIHLMLVGRGHTDGDLYIYLPKEKVLVSGDAVVDRMPFIGDGYPEEWIETVVALEKLDISQIIVGHGNPTPKSHLPFFRGFLTDLVAAVKQHGAAGMPLDDMKKKIAEDLAPKYEKGMSKYEGGRYRDRIHDNVAQVYGKLIKKG